MRPAPVRAIARAAAVPLSGLAWLAHRGATGGRAVVELVIDKREDTLHDAVRVARLRRLARDPTVSALLVVVRHVPGGWATVEDLRGALQAVRAAGKRVVAWVEEPGNGTMLLASAADEVAVPPLVDVNLVGVGAELPFAADALSRLGVRPDLVAAGAYKAFGEPFVRTHASAENLEATGALLADVQDALVAGLAEARGLSEEAVRQAVARAPLSPQAAVEARLVDRVAYLDQLRDELRERAGDGARRLEWRAWAVQDALLGWLEGWGRGPAVAVVHLQGGIVVDDESGRHAIRARRVVPLLDHLRDDEAVAAVVLHVHSPGGSAHASDLIWREVGRLVEKKPVVASFSDVSASGGYYLATAAREIWARPLTLTGSIGVFGGKLVVRGGLRHLGVKVQPVRVAPNSLWLSPLHPFDDAQRATLRDHLQRIYDGFVERAASGRGRPVEEVEPHCRGRVWSGRRAARLGLVDRLGGLDEAVARAAELADLAPGAWSRRDLSAPTPKPLAELVAQAVRRQVPGMEAAERVLGPAAAPWLDLVQRHPGEALALWNPPVDPR